ncbi:hypothetical protein FHS89_001288 [Rubricella aquisinus]|uniref:SRPBCC family protein n=1 Tax=Rubricella aquisinus TaxID=2028108 RepID=A0A840WJK3_9RHOB|nr:hypothetical protein [Rubricella aquisinus]MBB5515278.1 hypothetical protein [Rubricella aquisinus]
MKLHHEDLIECDDERAKAILTDPCRLSLGVEEVAVSPNGTGAWRLTGSYRDKEREAALIRLPEEEDGHMRWLLSGGGYRAKITVALHPRSPRKTELRVTTELSAETLRARLALRGMGLAEARIAKRYKKAVKRLGNHVEVLARS